MKIEGTKSLPSYFGQLVEDIFDENPLYKFKIPSNIINNYLPNKLPAFTSLKWKNLAKRYSIYSKPSVYTSRLKLSSNVEQLSKSLSLSDVLEELLTENDSSSRYNFVILNDCLIFIRVARLRDFPYYLFCELWYDENNGFQLNNNSGTYRPPDALINQTIELFNHLTPQLKFKGIEFQTNLQLSTKHQIMVKIKQKLNIYQDQISLKPWQI